MNEAMVRVQSVLSLPILTRCEAVTQLCKECSQKELQIIFPVILDSLFGINQPGWCLFMSSNAPTKEPSILFNFLCSQGPIFQIIYRLMADCYLKYEFPLTLLPPDVRVMFEEDMIPQFYLDKIQVDQHTKTVTSLALNPFEYYIFHFSSYLVNPWVVKNSVANHGDSVYILLCEDYMTCFLPCEGSSVMPPIDYYVVKSPVPRPPVVTIPVKTPTIFRQSILINKTNPPASLHSSPTAQANPHMEIWRTETLIQAFIDLWLTYGNSEATPGTTGIKERPSVDRVRAVRLMVKHFHYFSNSAGHDMLPMNELKNSIRQISRQKIYTFLRRTIQDWPLDSSFRVVLETWLSYIQPWRYTNFHTRSRTNILGPKDSEDNTRKVDRIWLNFIVENLFAYTVIYQQLIPRFARLDLTTPRNAHMLHRVTKVFSQPQLNIMLAEVEACLSDELRWPATSSIQSSSRHSRPPQSIPELVKKSTTVQIMGHKWNAILRQLLQELEGLHYEYTFLFDYTSEKIEEVLQMVFEANVAALVLLKAEEQMKQDQSWSFTSMLKSFFSYTPDTNEFTIDERRKVVTYLETCLEYLASFFMVKAPTVPDIRNMSLQEVSSLLRPGCSSLYQLISTSIFTPEGHSARSLQSLRFHKPTVSYEGDPDLQPVRTTECAVLVHLLHLISSKLNEMYGAQMQRLFYRQDIIGALSRQVLSPPLVVRCYDKSYSTQFATIVERVLSPRLSLRFLASIKLLGYFGSLFFIFWLWGCNPLFLAIFAVGVWVFYIFIRAMFEPLLSVQSRREPPSPQMNISDVSDTDMSSRSR